MRNTVFKLTETITISKKPHIESETDKDRHYFNIRNNKTAHLRGPIIRETLQKSIPNQQDRLEHKNKRHESVTRVFGAQLTARTGERTCSRRLRPPKTAIRIIWRKRLCSWRGLVGQKCGFSQKNRANRMQRCGSRSVLAAVSVWGRAISCGNCCLSMVFFANVRRSVLVLA